MMNDTRPPTDEGDAPRKSRQRAAEPTARQLVVPFLVTLFAVAAFVMFVYGFCVTPQG